MDASFSADCRVGRLVEARLIHLRNTGDVDEFTQSLRRAFTAAGARAIVCADWRQAQVLPPEAADGMIGLLKWGNAKFERSAVLLAREHATFNLQVERVIREAGNPARRAFRSVDEMIAWLGEILGPDERRRMLEFLG
jgi:hypothetical protein